MTRLSLPQAVLFDWDSTLVDNWAGIASALNAALSAFGHEPWTEATVRARAKKSARDSFPEIFGDHWQDALDLFYARFEVDHVEMLRPMPGAVALLDALGDAGVPLAVVSNKNGGFLRAEAAHLGWSGRFQRLIGGADAPRDKPAPDPILMVLEPIGIAPGPSVWFVGDSAVDMQCAHAAKCRAVLVETSEISSDELSAWPPHHKFPDCEEMKAAFFD